MSSPPGECGVCVTLADGGGGRRWSGGPLLAYEIIKTNGRAHGFPQENGISYTALYYIVVVVV